LVVLVSDFTFLSELYDRRNIVASAT